LKNYGYFDWKNREYVITNPKTPVKWINYIGTLEFGGFVDHTGGALLCKNDPSENRITKYIQQLPNYEFKGTTLYIRIKNQQGYGVFSPFFVPTLNQFQCYECHVGLGYSRIISKMYGIKTDVIIFVPTDDKCEIRDIRIENISNLPVEIDLIPVIEYSHPQALKNFTNADWIPQTMTSRVVDNEKSLKVVLQYPFMNRDLQVNYFTSNHPVSSFETDRKIFLGDNEYGTWMHPLALDKEEFSNYEANRGDNICALMHHFGVLYPDESKQLITQFGQVKKIDDARENIEKYRNSSSVDEAFAKLKYSWESYLEHFQIFSPDDHVNNMLNIFNPYQCYITKTWSRYLSYYQMGYGARGIGFRDSSQDVLGILHATPYEAKDLIKDLISIQWKNGSALHQFNPLSKKGSIGGAEESIYEINYYGDDHLWIILSIYEYLKETGDMNFLNEEVDYYDKDADGKAVESGTILDHMIRAVEFTHDNVGTHGIPLLGFADWNDSINLPVGSESFFIANLYGFALLNIIELADFLNRTEISGKYRNYYEEMKERVNSQGWDGNWYLRYYDNNGKPLGSKNDSECICYCNAQSWPVISGFATEERARNSLDAVSRLLDTEHGIKLSTKAYNSYDPKVGGITTYPPGAKENCGIFLHTNPWVILAETKMGNGDRAFRYYSQINPAHKNDLIDTYEVEPYVYAQNILADEHPQFGLGRNSWLSGTASWVYHVSTKYILGIRPELTGLCIDPCIPRNWDTFTVKRIFRGSSYRITVTNPDNINKGVKNITVNGKQIEGNIIPFSSSKKEYTVNVVMGEK
jgi:cellobiose phosphorylase